MSGAVNMAFGLSFSAMALGGGYLIGALGYRSLFLTGAGLTAAGALLFWAYFRVPRGELGRFFGLFALSGRAAAIVGPLVWTTVVYLFHPQRPIGQTAVELLGISDVDSGKLAYRVGILSLVVMMLIGLYIFRKVPDSGNERHG